MAFKLQDIRDIGLPAYKAQFGVDGRLWFSTLSENAILSVDFSSLQVHTHFSHDDGCAFDFKGNSGAIGTNDGRVFLFIVDEPSPRLLATAKSRCSIGTIDIHPDSASVFYTCKGTVYRVSFTGTDLGSWPCHLATYSIRFVQATSRLWMTCDGIEVLNIETNRSVVHGRGRGFPYYVSTAVAPNGEVACFRGDIDFFDSEGAPIGSVAGDYNRGIYSPTGRLLAREVTQDFPIDVSICARTTARMEFDVISTCDSYAMDGTGNVVVASHRGKLFLFCKR